VITIEVFSYIALSLTCLLILFVKNNYSQLLVILLVISYIVIVRYTGFHDDLLNYIRYLGYPIYLKIGNLYYLKEFIFWIGGSFIFQFLDFNEFLTFIFFDGICLWCIIITQRNFGLPSYFILLYFLMFPSVLGFQNVYRQFMATAFFLTSLSLSYRNKDSKYFFYLLSFFVHNVFGLLLPLLFLFDKRKYSKYFFWSSVVLVSIAFNFLAGTKSYSSHGLNMTYSYLAILFLWTLLIYSIKYRKERIFFQDVGQLSIALSVTLFLCYFFIGQSQLERLGMISIQIICPFVCLFIDFYFKQNRFITALFIISMILPIFIFSNGLSLLLR